MIAHPSPYTKSQRIPRTSIFAGNEASTKQNSMILVYQARPSLTLQNSEEGLADVISMHEMLTNQIPQFGRGSNNVTR